MLNWFNLERSDVADVVNDIDKICNNLSNAELILSDDCVAVQQRANLFSFGGGGFVDWEKDGADSVGYHCSADWMLNPTKTWGVESGALSYNLVPHDSDSVMREEVANIGFGSWWPMQVAWGDENNFDYFNEWTQRFSDLIGPSGDDEITGELFRIVGHCDGIPVAQPYAPAMMSMGLMYSTGTSFLTNDLWHDPRINKSASDWRSAGETLSCDTVKWMQGALASSSVLIMLRGCNADDYPIGAIAVINYPKFILGDDGIYDLMRVSNVSINVEGETHTASTNVRLTQRLEHNKSFFDNKTDLLSYAIGRDRFNSVFGNESVNGAQSELAFIPTWRDKRLPIHLNKGGANYSYHDLIRCSDCNGRVILMLHEGHAYNAVECPHCKSPKGVKCSHLKKGDCLE